jgi:hypothetical protein
MTKTSGESPTVRETHALYRGVPIVVELYGGYMKLRLKGKRDMYILDYEVAYECALKVAARYELAKKGVKI